MFGMGWQEILLIMVIAVLVIGPDQLPQVARTVGKMIAQFRRITNDLRDSLNKEFANREDFKEFKEFHQSIDAEFHTISTAAQTFVEKEVAKQEDELKKLEKEVKAATVPPSPGEPQAAWASTVGDLPTDKVASAQPGDQAEAGTNGRQETAAVGGNGSGKDASDPAGKGGSPRKESA